MAGLSASLFPGKEWRIAMVFLDGAYQVTDEKTSPRCWEILSELSVRVVERMSVAELVNVLSGDPQICGALEKQIKRVIEAGSITINRRKIPDAFTDTPPAKRVRKV
ncbi:hypothetical protein TWF481_003150 [Arthrobotrys musiformis]|uniref:Uncharacterized protein n=1 Tax=Arthrobotrys musiformis TaxID=47236 RepID=A0AAV9VQM3_9PEZI